MPVDESVKCAADDCEAEGEFECADCPAKICADHWITCSGDGQVEGCDAGLCPGCWEEHQGQHLSEYEESL